MNLGKIILDQPIQNIQVIKPIIFIHRFNPHALPAAGITQVHLIRQIPFCNTPIYLTDIIPGNNHLLTLLSLTISH
jgi:hypothetical protein